MSTINGGPNIITTGLILYYDAANTKSYISSSTTWVDISKNGTNGTLTNGPTYSSANGGSIVFDGVDDYINLGTYQSLINTFTVSFYSRLPSGFGNIFGFYNVSPPYNGWGIGYGQNPIFGTRLNFWDGVSWRDPNINIVDSLWKNICIVVNSTYLISFYIDGTLITSVQGATISPYIGNKAIGARPDAAGSITGNISQVQIYNRVLSSQEILQNFNATRARFSI